MHQVQLALAIDTPADQAQLKSNLERVVNADAVSAAGMEQPRISRAKTRRTTAARNFYRDAAGQISDSTSDAPGYSACSTTDVTAATHPAGARRRSADSTRGDLRSSNYHLNVARRLSRQIRRVPDRSTEQERMGRLVCRHLIAMLKDD